MHNPDRSPGGTPSLILNRRHRSPTKHSARGWERPFRPQRLGASRTSARRHKPIPLLSDTPKQAEPSSHAPQLGPQRIPMNPGAHSSTGTVPPPKKDPSWYRQRTSEPFASRWAHASWLAHIPCVNSSPRDSAPKSAHKPSERHPVSTRQGGAPTPTVHAQTPPDGLSRRHEQCSIPHSDVAHAPTVTSSPRQAGGNPAASKPGPASVPRSISPASLPASTPASILSTVCCW
jgi:hypothetical protein